MYLTDKATYHDISTLIRAKCILVKMDLEI